MLLKWEGETEYISGTKKLCSDAEHVIILPKGCSYEWMCVRAGHCSIIEFECEQSSAEIFSIRCADSERMLRIFRELEHEFFNKPDNYEMMIKIKMLKVARKDQLLLLPASIVLA